MSVKIDYSGDPASDKFIVQEYLFYLIAQVNALYDSGIEEVLKPIGLNKTRWRILMSLNERNGASVSAISEMASIKRSTISRMVEQMEKEDLVYRKSNDEDNRVTEVFIKPNGKVLLNRVLSVIAKQYHRSVNNIDEHDLLAVKSTLSSIIGNLKKSPLE